MYPKSSDKYPYKKREGYKQTQRGGQCEDRGRDWSDSCTSQGTPKSAPGRQHLGEVHGADSRKSRKQKPTLPTL